MAINLGDIFWIALENSEIPHPHVVIQDHGLDTVDVCALTTNLKRVNLPGNILLEPDEGNLPKQSLVEVAKVSTVDKARLGDYVGTLSQQRVSQIWAGIQFIERAFLNRNTGQ